MKSNSALSRTWTLAFVVNLWCIVGLVSSAPTAGQGSTAQLTTTVQPSTGWTGVSTAEWDLSTVDQVTTTETPPSSRFKVPDESTRSPAPTSSTPTAPATTVQAKPTEQSATRRPAARTTRQTTAAVKQQSPTPPTTPGKGDQDVSTSHVATLPPMTSGAPQTPALTTTERVTTTQTTTVTTHKPTPAVPTTNEPTELVPTTTVAQTTAPVQSAAATTKRVPITEGHQPVKTDGHQPKGTTEEHVLTTLTTDSGTDKTDTGLANKSVFSKLMLPVALGIVASILIICSAYAIRACRKKDSGRGRSKQMHNGKDQEMRGNFDRMKLLADSSEDEF